MPKQIVKDFEGGKAVLIQELVEASKDEPVKLHREEQAPQFVAFAPFVYGGKVYQAGDPFDVRGLARDEAFDEQFQIERKRKGTGDKGITFVLNGKRVILPVKEA
jgi:hypothetical protein